MSENCTDNCEVAKGLRRDVDDLKETVTVVVKELGTLKEVSASRTVEITNLTGVLNKMDTTLNTVLEKIETISIKMASLDFYTRQEVDNKIESATIGLREDVKNMKEEPAKDYKAIKMIVISCVVSAIVGGIIGGIAWK